MSPAKSELLHLVGSVPLRPASRVFDVLAERLPGLLARVPDGDQHGWVLAAAQSFLENDGLVQTRRAELTRGGVAVPLFQPKPGVDVSQLRLGPYGFAETAIRSHREFVERRERGQFRQDARFQVTMPGPGTSTFFIQLAPETLLPLAREALLREVERLVGAVPPGDLTIQLDVAMEAEHEEWRRRPEAFNTPIHEEFDWTLEQMAESVAWLANRIEIEAELGFHICSIWHHYPHAGQDNAVLVDIANEVVSRVTRPIGYVHVPTIPEHTAEDFAPFANLRLPPETRLYLGVIHGDDGFEGAIRRIDAARKVIPDFGIASFCGLGQPAAASPQADVSSVGEFELRRGRATTRQGATGTLAEETGDPLSYVLDLHRQLAERELVERRD